MDMGRTPQAAARSALYPPLPAGTRPLRVVALVDRTQVPAWLAAALAGLGEGGAAELVALAAVRTGRPPRGSRLFDAYLRLDMRFAGAMGAVHASRDLAALLPAVPRHAWRAASDAPLELDAEAAAELARLSPDLVLSFGLALPATKLAAMATHGVWSFGRDATDPMRAAFWMFAAFDRGEAVTPGGLGVHRSDRGRWELLEASVGSTALLSHARNRAYQLQKTPALLRRALRRLALGEEPEARPLPAAHAPDGMSCVALALRLLVRAADRHLPRLGKIEHWYLLWRQSSARLDPQAPGVEGFQRLDPPLGAFWADPCAYVHEGRRAIFVEELDYASGRGHISAIEPDADGAHRSGVVVKAACHLSYPRVFAWRDQLYLTFEAALERRLPLWRARRFPYEWEPVADLLRGYRMVDGTLHEEGGRWYLFVCVAETPFDDGGREWNELFLFHADSPLGPWLPHARNPIVADVRSARPAGGLFRHRGRLIRPAQDCGPDYGYRIVFQEVLELSPERYAERPLGALAPDWQPGLRGCHTYSVHDDLEVLDVKLLAPRRYARPARKAGDGRSPA
ncbi:putative formyl transferase [Mizugakiibacter sediminis]|uniref:Putative formyl transferase n=1 Tax=Mizugakiibacter sediminis TaxID=1475481 RepID=A0A0K8QP04_9GAMM|nr:hypothetical protein [Mizugakiibacter sediminis]GAP66456.1 putative formyl transferase [Mizugakiibacter sediminis]